MVNEEAAGLKFFFADFPKFLLYYTERSSLTYWREGTIRKCNSNGRLATTVTVASKITDGSYECFALVLDFVTTCFVETA